MMIYTSWNYLKNFKNSESLILFYNELINNYSVFIIYNGTKIYTELWKNISVIEGIDIEQNNIDLADFENNYKSSATEL